MEHFIKDSKGSFAEKREAERQARREAQERQDFDNYHSAIIVLLVFTFIGARHICITWNGLIFAIILGDLVEVKHNRFVVYTDDGKVAIQTSDLRVARGFLNE